MPDDLTKYQRAAGKRMTEESHRRDEKRLAAKLQQLADSLEFRGAVALLEPKIEVDADELPCIRITISVMTPDSEGEGRRIAVRFLRTYSMFEFTHREPVEMLRTQLQEMWLHELAEGVRVRGADYLFGNPHDPRTPRWPSQRTALDEMRDAMQRQAADTDRHLAGLEMATPPPDEEAPGSHPAEPGSSSGGVP